MSRRRALVSAEALTPPHAIGLARYDFASAAVQAESGGATVADEDAPQPEA